MFAPTSLIILSGLLLGAAIGAAARWAQFCTLGAIADSVIVGDHRRLRAFGLSIAIAIAGTQMLHMTGAIDISRSIYLSGAFGWLGALLGGTLFGLGMALVGTCGFGILIRLGGGDLRALVDLATLGIFAFITLSGPLAYLRLTAIEATDVTTPALASPGLPELVSFISGSDESIVRPIVVALVVVVLLYVSFRERDRRMRRKDLIAAAVIGLAVVAAWLATGRLGHDEFDPYPPVSFTFVRPLGESVLYMMLSSGMSLNFGIASVAGVLLGAHLVARAKNQLYREGFDGDREMLRHLGGSALMGVGGVLALGCTIGQGMSGMSTLALSAPLALLAIFAGSALGLRYLEEGSFLGALKILARRPTA